MFRSPIRWFGGKGHMVQKILPWFPPHCTYVEAFGGGASLLMAKNPSPVEIYNDIHEGLVSLFRALRDKQQVALLYEMLQLTPYSRREHADAWRLWRWCDDELLKAYHFFIAMRQSFAGCDSWGFVRTFGRRNMAMTVSGWLSAIDGLPEVIGRMKQVQVECVDWSRCVMTYDTPETLFYLDPPYPMATRRMCKYEHDFDDGDHARLLEAIQGVAGMVILSSYPNEMYDSLGWRRVDWETACFAAGRTRGTGILGKNTALGMQPRTECIYVSPNAERRMTVGRQLGLNLGMGEEE